MTIVSNILRHITAANNSDITESWDEIESIGIASFSYDSDFGILWGFASGDAGLYGIAEKLRQKKSQLTIVIVWDRIPSGNTGAVKTSRYLTPIDWAVALSLNIRRAAERLHNGKEGNLELPALRIVILDLGSHLEPGTDAMKALPHLTLEMPWVDVIRPDSSSLGTFVEELVGKRTPKQFMNVANTSMDFIEHLWRTALTKTSRPDDHHAIANLLGPLLMMGSASSLISNSEVSALRELMKALGFYPQSDKVTGDAPELRDAISHLQGRLKENGTTVLLMDDQWPTGWGEVICEISGVPFDPSKTDSGDAWTLISAKESGKPVVKASSNPKWLVKRLEKVVKKDVRFGLSLNNEHHNSSASEVLLLDLRLFSGEEVTKEAINILELVDLARQLKVEEGFDDLGNIESWAISAKKETDRNDPRYHQALTLLPRIIAEIDPSYPVIIFSSTGRREIVKLFVGYDNLLADFEKPRFIGLISPNAGKEACERLIRVLNEALCIIEGRKMLNRLTAAKTTNIFPVGQQTPIHVHVELYIDEHHPTYGNRNNIWVGGCYAMFIGKSKDEALAAAYSFDDALIENGYYYFSRGSYLPQIPAGLPVKAKNQDAVAELTAALESGKGPHKIEPVRFRCTTNINQQDDETGDFAYRQALTSLLEIFICELLPHVRKELPNAGVSFSAYAGTRVAEHFDEAFAKSLSYKYGLFLWRDRNDPSKCLLESMTSSALFPVIDDIRRFREARIEIEQAIAIRMIYDIGYDNKPSVGTEGRLFCRQCKIAFNEDKLTARIKSPNGSEYVEVVHVGINASGNDYGLIETIDGNIMDDHRRLSGRQSIYLHGQWISRFSLQQGDYLLVGLNKSNTRGYIVTNVLQKIDKAALPVSAIDWGTPRSCPICNSVTDVRPHYPMGLYIADQIMSQDFDSGAYKDLIRATNWGFDETVDLSLRDLLGAGRSVDKRNMVRAAWFAASVIGQQSAGIPNLHRIMLARIAPELKSMTGREFHEFAKALESQEEPHDLAVLREIIEVVRVKNSSGNIKLECKKSGGIMVTVSANQIQKAKLASNKLQRGSKLKATIFMENGKLYAKGIELVVGRSRYAAEKNFKSVYNLP